MVVRLRKGPTGPLADTVEPDVGITTLRWVDPATPALPSEQTGSAVNPFSTIQAALDSLAETGDLAAAVILAPGDYDGANAVWTSGERLTLQGYDGIRNIGTITSAIDGQLVLVGLGTSDGPVALLSITDTSVRLESCFIAAITAPGSPFVIRSSTITDAVTLGGLNGLDSTFRGVVQNPSATSMLRCNFQDAASLNGLTAQDCRFDGALTVTAGEDVEARDCVFTTVTAGIWSAWNCSFASGEVEELECTGCSASGLLTASVSARITSSTPLGGIDASGADLEIDSSSFAIARAAASVTFGTIAFLDEPVAESLTITVPAILAGSVGYANETLVGTTLEDLFAVGDPVTVCPQSDLVAAGLGGAFTNARISAANTLRCTFVGPLAGGDALFTVARVR
jgi:hypothetical protein